MESQRFAVAVHALVYLAYRAALSGQTSLASSELARTLPKHPGVIRRVIAQLGGAGLVETRSGSCGGSWLSRPAVSIRLSDVLAAVDGDEAASVPMAGAPENSAIAAAIRSANLAARERLATITIADLLNTVRSQA